MNLIPMLKSRVSKGRRVIKYYLQRLRCAVDTSIEETVPDFLCIGAARSGTTWLYGKLVKHPDFFVTKEKEIHFFDVPFSVNKQLHSVDKSESKTFYPATFDLGNNKSWRWYSLQFRGAGQKIKGDITPDYALLPDESIAKLCERMPNIKIVYMIRNPIERAWSGAGVFMFRDHGVGLDELDNQEQVLSWVTQGRRIANGSYREIIEKWERHLSPDRIHYVFYEDILKDTANQLSSIMSFVGLEPSRGTIEDTMGKRINSKYPKREIPIFVKAKLIDIYHDDIRYLEKKFGRSFEDWLHV